MGHGGAAARELAAEVKRQARAGQDPGSERKRAKQLLEAQAIRTFDDLADAYLAACQRGEWKPKGKLKRARTLNDEINILRRNVRPVIGSMRLEDITRSTIKALLRAMVDRGVHAQTNRTQAVICQCFAFGINEDETGQRLTINPATGFAPLGNETPRRSTYNDEALRCLWRAVDKPQSVQPTNGRPLKLGRQMAILLQLCMVLLQRKSEIAGMTTAELDLDRSTWLIPAQRSKNGREHLVPLPPSAVRLIREAIALAEAAPKKASADRNWRFVFPSPRGDDVAVRGDSVSHAQRLVCQSIGLMGVTVYDLRRTGATALASERLSFGPFAVSQVLGHSSDTGGGSAVTAQHYNVYGYVAEKRRALEAWAQLLEEIVTPAEAAA